MSQAKQGSRIAIVGAGQVGAAAAYALTLTSVCSEILVVDTKADLRDGQVRDLSDVAYCCNSVTRIRAATLLEASHCDIVVVTAGSKYLIGDTTMQHLYRNLAIVKGIVSTMKPFRPDTILLIVANPVDLLTSVAKEASGLPPTQVLGSGTFLDSVRLRGLLADKARVAANSIDLYVLGVHGDDQVVAWSTATVGGVPIDESLPPSTINHAELARESREVSHGIMQVKGAMPLGIGSIVSSICSSILVDKRDVRPISHFQPEFDCCFSLPVILGRQGVIRTIAVPLNREERGGIETSARELSNVLKRIKED